MTHCQYLQDLVGVEGGICPDQTFSYTDEHGMPHQVPPCKDDDDCCSTQKCFCMKRPGARPTDTGVCSARFAEPHKSRAKPSNWWDAFVPYKHGKVQWSAVAIDVGMIALILFVVAVLRGAMRPRLVV